MNSLLTRFAPVLVLAVMLGGFMAADRLWLHWYTPDAGSFPNRPPGAVTVVPARTPAPTPESSQAQTETAVLETRIRNAFAALWVVAQQTPYKVRYETSSESAGKGDSYLIFNKPPLSRVDTIPPAAAEPSVQIFIDAAGAAVRCTLVAGQRRCAPIEAFAAPLLYAAGPIAFPPAATFDAYDVTELDRRLIAGATTRCFHLAPTRAGLDPAADYCFSFADAPVLLYGRGTFGVVEASDVSTAVTDQDFIAPTPTPTPTDAARALRFTSVVTASPGGSASVSIQTNPGASCSIQFITPAGVPSTDQGLIAKPTDSTGAASWSWRIGSRTSLGIGTVIVTCDGAQASANISIG